MRVRVHAALFPNVRLLAVSEQSTRSATLTVAGFGIQDLGIGIWESGFGNRDLGFRIWDSGFGVQDLGLGT